MRTPSLGVGGAQGSPGLGNPSLVVSWASDWWKGGITRCDVSDIYEHGVKSKCKDSRMEWLLLSSMETLEEW